MQRNLKLATVARLLATFSGGSAKNRDILIYMALHAREMINVKT